MSKLHINIGNSANDRAGDPLRLAFDKVNQNFDELYANLTSYLPNPVGSSGKFLSTNGTDLIWESTVKFVQSNTAPSGNNSTLWYDQISGRIYTWYSNAWIDASPPTVDYKLDPPTSPQGAIGDVEGNWSGDFNYYYYCGANYTGNNAPIWRRVAFDSSNNWDIYNGNGGGASLPANAVGYLYNNGSGTITWTPNTQGYTLPQATNSVLGGVRVDGVTIVANNGIISSAPQLNADWDSSSGPSAILNKPTIPAAQIQSDWTVTDNTLKSFIRNKPSIPSVSNFAFSANQITVANNGAIRLLTNTHSWSFNNNGSLTYPDNSVQVTAYTGPAWPSQVGQGGKFLTTDGNVLSWATVAGGGGGGLSISDFGEGFSLTDADKIVTNKLYNNDITQPTQRYRLELTSTGVVVLPDQSIINGATLKTVAGNYAGITAGPAGSTDEDSWVWVDNNGATISTMTSTDNHQWKFDNNGVLTLPGSGTIFNTTSSSSFTATTSSGLNGDTKDFAVGGDVDIVTTAWTATGGGIVGTAAIINVTVGLSFTFVQFDQSFIASGPITFINSSGNSTLELSPDGLTTWTLGSDGTITSPNGSIQTSTGSINCQPEVDTVVYTSSQQGIQTIKLLLQVEGIVTTGDADTQSCEMIIAKGFRGPTVAASVYGIVYTSVAPLATFTADWNPTLLRVEVTCQPTSLLNNVNVRAVVTEITTSD
jgi:hypothetical protein